MNLLKLSRRAELDLDEIAAWTTKHFGADQSADYLDGLDETFLRLLKNPYLGRAVPYSKQNARSIEHVSHIVIYRILDDAVFIDRVVHRRRLIRKLIR